MSLRIYTLLTEEQLLLNIVVTIRNLSQEWYDFQMLKITIQTLKNSNNLKSLFIMINLLIFEKFVY